MKGGGGAGARVLRGGMAGEKYAMWGLTFSVAHEERLLYIVHCTLAGGWGGEEQKGGRGTISFWPAPFLKCRSSWPEHIEMSVLH